MPLPNQFPANLSSNPELLSRLRTLGDRSQPSLLLMSSDRSSDRHWYAAAVDQQQLTQLREDLDELREVVKDVVRRIGESNTSILLVGKEVDRVWNTLREHAPK